MVEPAKPMQIDIYIDEAFLDYLEENGLDRDCPNWQADTSDPDKVILAAYDVRAWDVPGCLRTSDVEMRESSTGRFVDPVSMEYADAERAA